MKKWSILLLLFPFSLIGHSSFAQSWIRINQLGYTPGGIKVAVWCSKQQQLPDSFYVAQAGTGKPVLRKKAGKGFGEYGPFTQTCRLDFTELNNSGRYYIQAGQDRSPEFTIDRDVYKGTADFCLRYMRQQRTGFNPYLKDSCHTRDGYALYGEKAGIPDSTFVDVTGGWHDASDYLQYVTTSANATYHLLAAYRDFPGVFGDEKLANGLNGKNGMADVLDEAKWGLDWLLKMHPRPDWMFNQIADDRDHISMRIPKEDSQYGRGNQRPVYFVSGEPQQRGKFMNNTEGTSSTAGKFASAFALGSNVFLDEQLKNNSGQLKTYATTLYHKAHSAFAYGLKKPGVCQTASVKSPYIYAEENWRDDMELGAVMSMNMKLGKEIAGAEDKKDYLGMAYAWAKEEPVTPWLGNDTAAHYQWYPFINVGHYELSRTLKDRRRDTVVQYYRQGIERVWNKAKENAFYRGVPFIWCSNNLTAAFAQQCIWYKKLTGDRRFDELEQANVDWLFGCNPWGTSMVYGLPAWGDTPVDPHAAFTHIKQYPIDGGLVDGPVYTSIYKGLIGIKLYQPDEYEAFQSNLAVYHDDYGDYSTNEPTMDGTASLIYLLAAKEAGSKAFQKDSEKFSYSHDAIIRGDTAKKTIAIVFTGDEYADGGDLIVKALKKEKIKASFFFTGRFYKNDSFAVVIEQLRNDGHYLGPHSDQHLLYCDWQKRDSLLVTQQQFQYDLGANYKAMEEKGINGAKARYFLPPFEWYNKQIAGWATEMGLQLVNYTPGTISHADYTWPDLPNYKSSDAIYKSILAYEKAKPAGLNGFLLLVHIGTDPRRTDKFYRRLPELLRYLRSKGYQFQRVDELLKVN